MPMLFSYSLITIIKDNEISAPCLKNIGAKPIEKKGQKWRYLLLPKGSLNKNKTQKQGLGLCAFSPVPGFWSRENSFSIPVVCSW